MRHGGRLAWKGIVLALGLGVVAGWVCWSGDSSAPRLTATDADTARIARIVARTLPRMHLLHSLCDDSIATNALALYIGMLDYDRTYFMAGDVAQFEQEATTLDDRLIDGDVSMAYRIYGVFMQRVSNRVDYANRLLDAGFDLNADEEYRWKRKDAPRAENPDAWDDLWRRKIKNEYLARIVADTLTEDQATKKNADTQTVATAAATPSTNAAAVGATGEVNRVITPTEFVRKRYKQFLTVMSDNDSEWILQRYLTAFAEAYDPHSEYMSASSTEDFDIGMKLSLSGIGALLGNEDGAAKVERIIPGGPADRDGRLKAGDKIIAVAQGDAEPVDVLHWPLNKTVGLIRGKKGSRVVLTVIPASDYTSSKTVAIDLVRDEVKLEEQAAKARLLEATNGDRRERRIGVIALPAFYADLRSRNGGPEGEEGRSSTRDVRDLMESLQTNRMDGLILDLRNNGGGSLLEAVEMTGLFIEAGPVVQVREGDRLQPLSDPDPDVVYDGPLMVLVNRQSASASEILAGALQDYGRALIVGDNKTHGKGTVQQLMPLSERNARLGSIKVTTSSFYRIAGGSTQLKGITPDLVIPSLLDTMEIGEEYLPNALQWSVANPALYRPMGDLKPLIPALERHSQERLAGDPQYIALTNLIQRFRERQAEQTVPLKLEKRLAAARTERALEDAENELLEEAPPTTRSVTNDLVLSESLRIMADLIDMQQKETLREHSVLENARRR